ncbi:thioredoxin domain-containing protein [Nocardia sp. IFM 10818]
MIGLIAAIGISIAGLKSNAGDARTAGFAPEVSTSATVPANVTPGGAIRVGAPQAPVRIQEITDLQCPACRMYDQANAALIEAELAVGTISVEYNIISFLDRFSNGNRYSSRAANAAYVVASHDPAKFPHWLELMFAAQPGEGGNGMTDDQLIAVAHAAGYTDPTVAQHIRDNIYADYIEDETRAVLNTGLNSTPSVFVNGTLVDDPAALMTPDGLAPVIAAAKL